MKISAHYWRKLTYKTADGYTQKISFAVSPKWEISLKEAKEYCKLHGFRFIYLSKRLYDKYDEVVK